MSPSSLLHRPGRGLRIVSFLIVLFAALTAAVSWHLRKSAASQSGEDTTTQTSVDQGTIARNYGELPLSFERNDGQADHNVKFISRAPGFDLFLTSSGAILNLRSSSQRDPKQITSERSGAQSTSQLYLEMIGANQSSAVDGNDELPGKINYLVGDDPAAWHTGIPTFRRVKYSGIVPGVDLVYYGNRRQLEYDFVLGPHAKLESIRFRIHGAGRITIGKEGHLRLATKQGEVQLLKPEIYQLNDNGERQQVQGAYRVKGSEIGFTVGRFDSKRPLIIDPVLAYATLLGAGNNDAANGIAVDSQGFAYITGSTGAGFPTTAGALQTTSNGTVSGFVTKLDQTGTSLIYSTYLSGASPSGNTNANAIVLDSSGNPIVTGSTTSADFPLLNPLRGGRNNLLVTTDSGATWVPSNVGTANRPVQALAIDKNTPTTMYACIGTNSGGIFKTTDGGLNWVSLNTGVQGPTCNAIVIDPASPNNVYAALTSNSTPSPNGVYKTVNGGNNWSLANSGIGTIGVTALAIDPQNPATLYAATATSFFKTTNGGTSWASATTGMTSFNATSIVIDPVSPTIIYVGTAGGVFKTTNGGANWASVINGLTNTNVRALAIDPATPATVYAGTLNGVFKTINSAGGWAPASVGLPQNLNVTSLAVDPSGTSNVYLGTGDGRIFKSTNGGSNWSLLYSTTTNTSFPALLVHPGNSAKVFAATSSFNQNMSDSDAFVTKLNSTGSGLVYSTLLGGTGNDGANGIALDVSGNMYVAGQTNSINFPTVNAAQATLGGGTFNDAFVTKLNATGSALVYSTYLGGPSTDAARWIAVDSSGNAYVAGDTNSSTNFATAGAFQTVLGDPTGDAFASKFDANGAIVYATYLGGNFTDVGRGIAADSQGNAYVTGTTQSANFPTANALQSNNDGFIDDAFVTKVNPTGNSLVYSTYLGGSDSDFGRAITLDAAGNAYVTGSSASLDFPLVAGAIRTKSPLFKSFDGGNSWRNDNFGFDRFNIIAMAIDPTATSKIYAGTDAKNYRSVDGGRTWTSSMTGIGTTVVVRSIVVNPASPSTVYLATSFGSNGVFKSTDAGQSWNPASNGLGANTGVSSLVMDPNTPATLYAATVAGLFKSIDNAGSWTKIGPSNFLPSKLVIDPLTPTTLYASLSGANAGVSKSIDSGATWQPINSGLTSTFIPDLAIDPKNPATLYAAAGGGGFFKTTNGGASWTSTSTTLTSPIAVDPTNPANVYATGTNGSTSTGLFKSIDGGATWTSVNTGLRSSSISAILVSPTNSSIVYVGNSSGRDSDAFVTKLNAAGNAFVYSTLIGGSVNGLQTNSSDDQGAAIALDASGTTYIAGVSSANDFASDPNAYQPFNRGSQDAFIAKLLNSYIISGQVLDTNNAPVSGALVTLSEGPSLTQVFTESDGTYQFTPLREGGGFTVAATKPHFTMTPTSQTFSNLGSNQTQNFVATATNNPFYVISGQVTANGNPLRGVRVDLTGAQQNFVTTEANGNYSFTVAGGANYIVAPSILGYTFAPTNQTFNNLGADQTANFAGTRQNFVVTNANNHGTGSLRQAITDANATPGLDTITFNIPGGGIQTINLLIVLPTITDPVVIDATTQPGYAGSPLIELSGSQAGNQAAGFQITAGNSTIRGFAIGGFTSAGIVINTNGGNTIQANYIGLDATGTVARQNQNGILVGTPASNNLIGGTTASARNVISGSTFAGITLGGANNTVQGNFIGTNASGTAAIPNGIRGIDVTSSVQMNNNLIGGTAPGAGNLISGNGNAGISLGPGNIVQGNLIGTDVTGLKAIPNSNGINVQSGGGLIGGSAPGARNVISGNSGDGLMVGGVNNNLTAVQGNFIGTDITGNAALGNGGTGISVSGAGVTIGGTTAAARNIISGNGGFGNVSLSSVTSGCTIQGNYIGTDVTGNVALTNPKPGISIQTSGNTIGGVAAGAGNLISGNTVGIQIGGNTTGQVNANLIQGNLIGLNQAGSALPNAVEGIRFENSSTPPANNVIGGTANGAANTIAFNGSSGVLVLTGTADSIRGNSIFSNGGLGIDLAPNGPTANDQGDADTGANNRQNFPVLTSLTPSPNPTTINGTLNSTASTAFTIDFYANTTCDPSGSGEGAQYLASTMATTGADGNAAINFTLASALPAGTIVTATATDSAGNTSEFSPCLSGANISFSQANYSVTEGDGSLNVTVTRTGDTAVPVAVDYATTDSGASAVSCATPGGKASAKCDFSDAFGTVRFAAGETSKTISVLITQDYYVEGPETFTLSLSNAIAAMLQSPSSATITVNDEVTEPPGNAIDDAAIFVRQHYHDFLNREPDQAGLDFWTGQITSCGSDVQCNEVRRIDVSASFFLSIEFQQTGYLVERMYKVAYGDATGTSTLGGNSHNLVVPTVRFAEFLKDTQRIGQGVIVLAPGWEQALENNKQAYAQEFVSTNRFATAYPTTMTPAQFVDLFNSRSGNVLSLTERTAVINMFGGAANTGNLSVRAQVLRQVAEDVDLYNAELNRAFVLAQYFGYLRRNPNDPQDTDYTGFEFWLSKLNQFNGNYIAAEMVKAFISSFEYRQRFGQ